MLEYLLRASGLLSRSSRQAHLLSSIVLHSSLGQRKPGRIASQFSSLHEPTWVLIWFGGGTLFQGGERHDHDLSGTMFWH